MAEYIDREALIADIDEEIEHDSKMYTREQNYYIEKGLRIARKDIQSAPAADVAEVKHGEWIDGRCTNCNYKTDIEQIGFNCCGDGVHVKYKETNFCPNCGAKMNGKENAE